MGVISSNNFDPTRGYVGVRLQQGVPIVDRDWNEMEDIHKFELRTFLKWFVGNGVPQSSDAFRIESTGEADNFLIHSGESGSHSGISNQDIGLYFAGNFLVDGLEVSFKNDIKLKDQNDIKFQDQPLHVRQPNANTLATTLGVPVISAVSLPPAPNTMVVVYLDVWERLVAPTDDPDNLILSGLGTESCARTKREWVVRANTIPTTGTPLLPSVPVAAGSGYPEGHSFYALATIMNDGSVNDLRQTRLTLADLVQRVSTLETRFVIPAFNPSPNQFSPTSGALGSFVTLHGKNFTLGTPQVIFGSNPGVPSTNIGPTFTGTNLEIYAQVPLGVSGNVTITVSTNGGIVTSQDTFTVIPPPTFNPPGSQFTPTSMFANSPVQVTINGNNFAEGNLFVGFNALDTSNNPTGNITPVAIFSSSPTQIVTAPAQNLTTLGNYKILVQTDGGMRLSDDPFAVVQKPKETKEGKDKDKEKETKETKEKDKEKESKETKDIKDKDTKEGKENDKIRAVEKVTAVEKVRAENIIDQMVRNSEGDVSGPTGLPPQVTERSGFVEQPAGQAFIAPAERPDVGANVLKQADEEADQEKGESE